MKILVVMRPTLCLGRHSNMAVIITCREHHASIHLPDNSDITSEMLKYFMTLLFDDNEII